MRVLGSIFAVVLALLSASALAQEDISVPPTDAEALQNLYVSLAISEYCQIPLGQEVATLVGHEVVAYEKALSLTEDQSMTIYGQVLTEVEEAKPDCSGDSVDTAKVHLMIEMFKLRLL